MTMTTQTKPASPKQLKWLRDLLTERDTTTWPANWAGIADALRKAFKVIDDEGLEPGALQVKLAMAGKPPVSHDDFQRLLPKLQSAPKVVAIPGLPGVTVTVPVKLEDGMYKVGDTFYKVKHSQNKQQWAHRLIVTGSGDNIVGKFVYAGRPSSFHITPECALSYEDAKAFGALYNMCVCCGRLLTNELSVVLGIGPVCGKRQFGGNFKHLLTEAQLKVDAANKAIGA